MTPEQALVNIINALHDDRLRFFNYREFTLLDQSLAVIGELIKDPLKEKSETSNKSKGKPK